MAELNPNQSVVNMHAGYNGDAWTNSNLYVVKWADRNLEKPPKIGYKLKENEEYQLRVKFKNESPKRISAMVVEFSIAYSGTGLRYENSTQLPLERADSIPANSEFVLKSSNIYRPTGSGHQCMYAVVKFYLLEGEGLTQFVIPLNSSGVIKGKSKIVAQHNSHVSKIDNNTTSLSYDYHIDESVNELIVQRLALADHKDLLDVNGESNLTQEAKEDPKFLIYVDGQDMPSQVFYPDDIKNMKSIDMSSYQNTKIKVVVELPKTREANDGAIYQFKASDDSDGVVMVLAYQ